MFCCTNIAEINAINIYFHIQDKPKEKKLKVFDAVVVCAYVLGVVKILSNENKLVNWTFGK